MLSLLSLGLKCGTEVTVTVDGGDEEAALSVVADFIANFS
jgi:phosphotransferase system HPr-like phosphotransfer protein